MKNPCYSLIGVLVLIMCSCATKPGSGNNPLFISDVTTNYKSIFYVGFLPCADCDSMKTVIRLNKDSTYIMESLLSDEIAHSKGTYSWKKDFIILKSSDESSTQIGFFKISGNKLLPRDGKEVAGSERFYLVKSEGIFEVNWKLVELNGNSIGFENGVKEPHFVLKLLDNRIVGNGGCNGFGGNYEFTKGNGIRISNLISTKMACMEITYESDFLHSLEKADNYLTTSDTLLLKSDDEVLAKFVRIEK